MTDELENGQDVKIKDESLSLWTEKVSPAFFSIFENYVLAVRKYQNKDNPELFKRPADQFEPTGNFTGQGWCEAAAHVWAAAIQKKFKLTHDQVRVVKGQHVDIDNTRTPDAWVKITSPSGILIIHPTYGQFSTEYKRKALVIKESQLNQYHLHSEQENNQAFNQRLRTTADFEGVEAERLYRNAYRDLVGRKISDKIATTS